MDPILIVVLVALAVVALGAVAYVAVRGRGTTELGPRGDAGLGTPDAAVDVLDRPTVAVDEAPGDVVVEEAPAVKPSILRSAHQVTEGLHRTSSAASSDSGRSTTRRGKTSKRR